MPPLKRVNSDTKAVLSISFDSSSLLRFNKFNCALLYSRMFDSPISNFDLYEQLNWIESCPTCWAFVDCGGCIWDYQFVVIDLMLPSEVVAGTINQLRIVPTESWCLRDSTTFCVKAVSPVGVNKSSWSRIKSIKESKEY